MIQNLSYSDDIWENFEIALRFALTTYEQIGSLLTHNPNRFKLNTEDIYIRITSCNKDKNNTKFFMCAEKTYKEDGYSIEETIQKIKKLLQNKKTIKIFLNEKGDGYSFGFNKDDGFVDVAYCMSYDNSRAGFVFGLTHIYYGN